MDFSKTRNSTILIVLFEFLVTSYINLRQYLKLASPITPAASKIYSPEKYNLSCQYNREKLVFSFVSHFYSLLQTILSIFYFKSWYSYFTTKICKYDELFISFFIFVTTVLCIPFSLYYDFVLEKKYGFNKKTLKLFFKDFAISSILSFVISTPLLFICKYTLNHFDNFPLYLTLFLLLFRIFMIVIYPNFITPLFNKVTPLEEGELKNRVEKLAGDIGFTIDKIEVIDGSCRSSHSNAYFIGIFKAKRIVFFDTLLKQMNNDEIMAVLCHELGHWYHNHILYNTLISSVHTFTMFCLLKFLNFKKGEFSYDSNTIRFSYFISAIFLPLGFLLNFISRTFEKQADKFAVKKGYGRHLINGLLKLSVENMGSPVVDWLFSAFRLSHPHITERIECIESSLAKQE